MKHCQHNRILAILAALLVCVLALPVFGSIPRSEISSPPRLCASAGDYEFADSVKRQEDFSRAEAQGRREITLSLSLDFAGQVHGPWSIIHGPPPDQRIGFVDVDATTGAAKYYYYLTDQVGSVLAVMDEDGEVVNRYDYDAFGNLHEATSFETVENRYRFHGREWDEHAQHYYYRYRTYLPELGAFIGPDMKLDISDGMGQGNYVFANNNPLVFVDPLGLWSLPWFGGKKLLTFGEEEEWGTPEVSGAVRWTAAGLQLGGNIALGVVTGGASTLVTAGTLSKGMLGVALATDAALSAYDVSHGAVEVSRGHKSGYLEIAGGVVGLGGLRGGVKAFSNFDEVADAGKTAKAAIEAAGETVSAPGSGPTRVTQYYDPQKGPFPVDGEFALSSKPSAGNKLIDGITGETTWVAPRPAAEMSQWRRLWTGVGNRRHYVEFDILPGELHSPAGLKSLFDRSQQVIQEPVSLTGRNAIYGMSSFNYIDAGIRYVGLPAAAAGTGYWLYREVQE